MRVERARGCRVRLIEGDAALGPRLEPRRRGAQRAVEAHAARADRVEYEQQHVRRVGRGRCKIRQRSLRTPRSQDRATATEQRKEHRQSQRTAPNDSRYCCFVGAIHPGQLHGSAERQ